MEKKGGRGPSLRFDLWLGPVFAISVCIFIGALRFTSFSIPNPPAFLLLVVVFSSFIGGLPSGLLSGLISWIFLAFYFSNPGELFAYTDDNFRRVVIWGFTIPLISIMVGVLKHRSEAALLAQLEARRREEEMKSARDAAETASEAKSTFLANMSHEIRTPLGVVVGCAELMATESLTTPERLRYLEMIKRNGDLLCAIINDILDLTKVEAGKFNVSKQAVSLEEILFDLATVWRLKANEKGLNLTVSTVGPVPVRLTTDPLRLRQILFNIVGNAIKFTNKGTIEVIVRAVPKGKHVTLIIEVKDTGVGISPEQAKQLFQRFTQLDMTRTRRFGGTGLGLVLSRELAHLLGGDVVLTGSVPGQGSTFTISIDAGTVDEMRTLSAPEPFKSSVQPRSASKSPTSKLDGVRVLLVDDAADNQALVGRLLSLAGATVETAVNGREAIEKVHRKPYDVVLMDLQMPIMDGYEATARLRKDGYERPILALTAHALEKEREHCLAGGFNDHLSKPVNRAMLIDKIGQYAAIAQAK